MDGIHSENQAMRNDVSFVRNQIPVLQDGVYGLQVGVDKLQLGVDGFQRDKDRQKHHMLMEWISSTNFPAQQSDLIGRRQAGTGQWFLNSPKFAKWLYGPNETLFCPGIPGAGKTMMAAITIDHLSTTTESDAIGIAYIFCNYKAQADQNTISLLAAFLKQLVQARPSIAEPVSRLYEHHSSRRTKPSLEEIFTALQIVVKNLTRVYVVIDALDECSDRDGTRSRLLAKLRDLQREADVHLIVTSRCIPDIENEFRLVPTLEIRASDADVKRFVEGHIYRLPRCIQRDNELQGFMEDKIVEAVDGMLVLRVLYQRVISSRLCQVSSCSSPRGFASRQANQSKSALYVGEAFQRLEITR
jgi:NACHT domain